MTYTKSDAATSTRPAGLRSAGVLGAALYATFSAGSPWALPMPIAVDIDPDVTLGTYALDLNGDGIVDYDFTLNLFPPIGGENDVTTGSNSVVGFVVPSDSSTTKPGTYASALAAGDFIFSSTSPGYVSGTNVILSGKLIQYYGEFLPEGTAFVGLQFVIPDGTHYGWVEVQSGGEPSGGDGSIPTITLTRFGYECQPDTGINAGEGTANVTCGAASVPEPGSLALLIAGAAGILALRRRQRAFA